MMIECFQPGRHESRHLPQLACRTHIFKKLSTLKFDAVAVKLCHFSRPDPILDLRWVVIAALDHPEEDCDGLKVSGLLVCDLEDTCMLEDADDVRVGRVVVLPVKIPLEVCFVELG
jgi:hypothetical protein